MNREVHLCTVCCKEMRPMDELKTVGEIPYHAKCADQILEGEPKEEDKSNNEGIPKHWN